MRTIDPRNLLNDDTKETQVGGEVFKVYNQWKEMFEKKTGRKPNELDSFFAGYILANPTVRIEYKKIQEKELPYDFRINEQYKSKTHTKRKGE